MPKADIISDSTALLTFLSQLSPFSNDEVYKEDYAPLLLERRTTLTEQRANVDLLARKLQNCSWAIEVLLRSLDQVKDTERLTREHRTWHISEANQLVDARPASVHLPYELLLLIARYANPEPISTDRVDEFEGSGCKWDKIVLKSSFLYLDRWSFEFPPFPTNLPDPSPKLVIDWSRSTPSNAAVVLLPYRDRVHSLSLEAGTGATFLKELLELPCPDCLPYEVPSGKCEDHAFLPPLHTLTTSPTRWTIPSFSGLFKNIKHISLIVAVMDVNEPALNFSEVVTGAPLLSQLTVTWQARTVLEPPKLVRPKIKPPNLRRVVFVQRKPALRTRGLQFVFGSLCGDLVEEFHAQFLDPFDADEMEVTEVTEFLHETFPSIKSLAFRAHAVEIEDVTEVLEPQCDFLKTLITAVDGGKSIFPHVTNLFLQLDRTTEGLDTLLRALRWRHDHQGPSLQEIQSLTLFMEETPSWQISPPSPFSLDYISRVQSWVKHLTICRDV